MGPDNNSSAPLAFKLMWQADASLGIQNVLWGDN